MTRIEVPNPSLRRSASSRIVRTLVLLAVLSIVVLVLWTWLTLSWAYSEGERAGILQKFSRKGWLCKTYEGEIALYYGGGPYMGTGSSPQFWIFSVRDAAVAEQIAKAVGHRVQLHYTEHPGIPTSCFAETRYFVDRVTDDEGANPAGARPGAPGQPSMGQPSMGQPSMGQPDVRPGSTVVPPPAPPTP
jgi:hypothetical protein